MDLHIKKILVPGNCIMKDDDINPHIYQNISSKGDNDCSSTFSGSVKRSTSLLFGYPSAKKMRLEEKPSDVTKLKRIIIQWKKNKLDFITQSYNYHLLEYYFLDNEGNLMDMQSWLKNPSTELMNFAKKRKLEQDSTLEVGLLGYSTLQQNNPIKIKEEPQLSSSSLSPKPSKKYLSSVKHKVDDTSVNSQQAQMVEKAKQEAYIMQRISVLRKDGVWTEKRLPKVQEPSRPKAHWDYLLEEMVWLSHDFAQERKWKKAAAKKCAKMVQKYFQDKALQAQKAEREQELKLRRIASFAAKEVRTFWNNVSKIIEYKVNARLEMEKKKALDQQLSFIVVQSEKMSSRLAEGLTKGETIKPTPQPPIIMDSESDFNPDDCSDDDECTIKKEDDNPEEQASEIKLLQKESEQTLEDILKDLPADYFDNRESITPSTDVDNGSEGTPDTNSLADNASTGDKEEDQDFEAVGSGEDDEETIKEEEEKETEDHEKEIQELEAENEMSVDELRKKYEGASQGKEDSDDDISMKSQSDEEAEMDVDVPEEQEEEDNSLGLEDLLDQSFSETQTFDSKERSVKADKELKNAAAVAESLQPKGFTLSSTSVTTPIPFLLKHTLREYQHVGLDWLVTMYEKRFNGILADEMGLGKTIQTIALLAHLACEKKIWGPHLVVVPTSVMLNWEMEFKKWCPAFKILTYYGSQKERKLKRQGWTKENAFHVCITSYKLVIQDHQSFRRKKWRYLILDEAQNIKNFKSQRWQLLLNFQSSRRLLLTGTPLQNNLMELWSLMHFLMPSIFASHREFKEWFSNPVTGMIEGNKEYNDNIIKRLHKVLRPFILRRLKSEVEKQMPKKYEHIVMCKLSKRQRFLYEEFMSRTKTRETLASGNFLSVINILMQLRKVCNHPNLFEPRPTVSPLMMEGINYTAPSIISGIVDYDPFKHVDLFSLNLLLSELERCLTAFAAHRIRKFKAPHKLIEEIDNAQQPPPKCPAGKIKLHVRPSSQPIPRPSPFIQNQRPAAPSVLTLKPINSATTVPTTPAQPTNVTTGTSQWQSGVRFQLVQHGGAYKAIPLPAGSQGGMIVQQTPTGPKLMMPQRTVQSIGTTGANVAAATGGTTHPGLQLVQTSAGNYLLTSAPVQKAVTTTTANAANSTMALLQRLQGLKNLQGSVITTGAGGRPVLRLPPSASFRPTVQSQHLITTSIPNATQRPITQLSTTQSVTTSVIKPTPASTSVNSTPSASPAKPIPRPQINEVKEPEPIKKKEAPKKSIFYLNEVEEERKCRRKKKLEFIAKLNTRRCHACPIYGCDLMEAVTVLRGSIEQGALNGRSFQGQGMVFCSNAISPDVQQYWAQTETLHQIVKTPTGCLDQIRDITDRFVFCVPPVLAPIPKLRVFHPPPSTLLKQSSQKQFLTKELSLPIAPLHPIINASATQFPDPRLIQYDCGKLQTLDRLLRRLKDGSHRVLIFTQMTKMLNIFESFLNFHGHLYLRLDGSTKIEQRQTLMERFNKDKRIFVFILSTRSGGIGVNLTGADTVIFYDSDWNPTMDAQAQDRCHRIGQTRDVHIYRLISEKTIEENILKKANQKRLLGDLAIEGGNFTTASLKSNTIQDLFKVDASEQDANKRMSDVLEKRNITGEETPGMENTKDLESALAAAEDETDVEATKTAKAEADAELLEFDENVPFEEAEEITKEEHKVAQLVKQLTPIERYALHFLEESDEAMTAEAERLAAEIEKQKECWETARQKTLQEEEDRIRMEESNELLSYSADDARNKIWMTEDSKNVMPIWCPPTPPHDDNDLYVDSCFSWYESTPITESELPQVYVKRENNKRIKLESSKSMPMEQMPMSIRGPIKVKQEDGTYAPKSLFDRRDPKRDLKKCPLVALKSQAVMSKPFYYDSNTDWLIHEEWTIVQTILKDLQLPLSLTPQSNAHVVNWDLISDMVNICSVSYRSVRQCRSRYESCLMLREENKEPILSAEGIKKFKKNKYVGAISNKQNTRGLGTYQLYQQDNNSKFSSLASTRFETLKSISVKKTPTMKPMHVNPSSKNSKHGIVLSDYGINYDDPLTPVAVATNRADRIREKQKSQAETAQQQRLHAATAAAQLQQPITTSQLQRQLQSQQQIVIPQSQQQVAVVAAAAAVSTGNVTQQLQQAAVVVSVGGSSGKMATSVVLTNSGGSNASIATYSTTATSIASSNTATATILSGVRTAGQSSTGRTTTLTLQDLQGRTRTGQATVVSVASIGQLQAAKLTAGTLTTQGTQQRSIAGVPLQTRTTLLPQQMQYLRHAQRQTLDLQSGKVVATSNTGEQQTIKRVQIASQPGTPKVQVAVSAGGVPGITAIQMVRPGLGGVSGSGNKTLTRTVTESEMSALLRRQPQHFHKVFPKQRSLIGVKGATLGVLGGKGSGMVQILQGSTAQKQVTVQQVIKQVQQQSQNVSQGNVIGKTVVPTASGNSGVLQTSLSSNQSAKLIPITVSTQQPIKQTIQVVSAGSSSTMGGVGIASGGLRISTADRTPGLSVVQGSTTRVSNPTILSGAYQGQPLSVAVKNQNPIRIQTTSVTTSSQQTSTQQDTTTNTPPTTQAS